MAPATSHDPFSLLAPCFYLAIVLPISLSGCGGGHSDGQPAVTSAPSTSAVQPAASDFSNDAHGHFIGEVASGGEGYYAEALLTVDGELRIYVSDLAGVWSNSGAAPPAELFHPQHSILFVGTIDGTDRASASGTGAVIGQICDGDSARFCDEPAPAEVFLEVSSGDGQRLLTGELGVMTGAEEERWAIQLGSHSIYYGSGAANPGQYPGVFEERLAPFAQAENMKLQIDPDGRMSFVSVVSGCAAEGMLLPHLDGRFNVYDVNLRIANCNAQFAYLNSEFGGLATETQSGTWDYDTWLVIFLSAPDGPAPRPALTMRAYLQDDAGEGYWDY